MKKKILTMMMLTTMVSACGTLMSTMSERSARIEQGMTKDEVQKALGKPDYRRFDRDREQWEYRQHLLNGDHDVMLVDFEDGRVVSLDSFYEHHPQLPEIPQNNVKKE
ncbi:MAG: outer membrane protein assembly factor BamE [Prevotella sp.]|nr:outer membrane protein assembly factor BamE [Prevotella sp.]